VRNGHHEFPSHLFQLRVCTYMLSLGSYQNWVTFTRLTPGFHSAIVNQGDSNLVRRNSPKPRDILRSNGEIRRDSKAGD
jgi:hypothetical protein